MRRAIFALPLALVLAAACAPTPGPAVDTTQVHVSVSYRERIMLPPGHVVSVRVEDVSRADAPAVVVGEASMTTGERGPPYELTVDVPTNRIDPRLEYAVRAEIREPGGALRFTTDTRHSVLTRGAPDRAEIMLVAAR
ncbi:YbaY family lipoprotein [Brevundimonas sp. Root1279]|uniref:YbaY family lipoprotein n=1 Tax=Brevundimonas sp. Root1279 TaxID=1736443 RepID=UPI0006F73EAF|nr:YbaY family lipoprotein [Brevundimonas sp. Root1279]KQW79669.1 hypothetical protein ASC65_14035 [Brevundimonas sp. Root1279]